MKGGNVVMLYGPDDCILEPEGLFISYTGDEEITPDWYIKDGEPLLRPAPPSLDHSFKTQQDLTMLLLHEGDLRDGRLK